MANNWIEIDGSQGEGGGQVLRTSLALSILTGQPIRLQSIRGRRPKPGLRAQHLASVRAAGEICLAQIRGASLGGASLEFEPGEVQSGNYQFRIGTAGATALVLQTVYLPLLLKGQALTTLRIEGGTHTLAAPSGEFLSLTWAGYLRLLGQPLEVTIDRLGFFPRGGGVLTARIAPAPCVRPLVMTEVLPSESDQWEFLSILGGGLPISIARRMSRRVQDRLGTSGSVRIREYPRSTSPGVVATLIDCRGPVPAIFFGLGAKGRPAERVADEAVEQYLAHRRSRAAVDPHSADQLILPLALAPGVSTFTVSEVTGHLLTKLSIVRRFVERKMTCEGSLGQPGLVTIS
jgi:RNA 3'-terminal phosphate cyclase (ATP)